MFLAALSQATLLPYLKIMGLRIDIVMILVVCWILIKDVDDGVVWAIIGGLFLDLMSLAPFGTYVLALVPVVAVTSFFKALIPVYHSLLPFAVIPIASILYNLTANLVLVIFGAPGEWPATVALIVLPATLVDSVAGLLIFWLISMFRNQFSSDAAF